MKNMPHHYSPLNPTALFTIQRRQRVLRKILEKRFPEGVREASLLEIGCGWGQWLIEFQMFGFDEKNISGAEIDEKRHKTACKRLKSADIRLCDAEKLPWKDGSFDVVFQSTVFTSILDSGKKRAVAEEMKRVCAPGGCILWYDFTYNNPSNPKVKGVSRSELKKLFKPWKCEIERVTLAPPIARKIVQRSWTAAEVIESVCPFLRTHIFAVITPKSSK